MYGKPLHPRFIIALAAMGLSLVFDGRPTLARQADPASDQRFDLLITGGRVLDGTGNPWFLADVGIRDGRIAALGDLTGARATRSIDARGLTVTPGFIDIHSHADDGSDRDGEGTLRDAADARRRAAPNLVMQGITTVVVNQDGRSVWPIGEQRAAMTRLGIGPNALLLIGHGEVRRRAMGDEFRRPATEAEIARMQALVRQGMDEGAWGLSAGLEYAPGRWSTTDEVVALAREIAPYRGVYISHERSEGADPMWYWPSQDPPGPPTLIDAIQETIEIGERSGAVVVASHIKAKGAHYWGTSGAAIQLIESARKRGVQVYADQYPYDTSGSDGSTVLVPGWAFQDARRGDTPPDFTAALRSVLEDPSAATRLRLDIAHEIRRRGGEAKVLVFDHPDSTYVGRSLAELARRRDLSPVEMAIRLQLEGFADRRGGARVRGFSLSDLDIEAYAARSWVATATDGGIALPEDGPAVHARYYGTFPRKIAHYAIERGVLSIEDAVRSATSLPAQILGLNDRGIIQEGAVADVVLVDLDRIRDTATFVEPHQYPEGIVHVLVNGESVVHDGRLTNALPGRVLTIQEYRRRPPTP
jgi:N-acyl-D-amino-acid deacylase